MRVRESPLRDLLRLIIWYPFRWAAQCLPPRALLAVLRALGDAHWALAPGKRRRLARNILRLGPQTQRHAGDPVRENFRTHYVSQLLVFAYRRLTRASLRELAEFEGLDHLEAALALGRGAVLVQAHFGPEQLAMAGLALLGHRVMQIGCINDTGLSRIGKYVSLRLRRRYEAEIPGEMRDARAGVLPALRVLRENGLVLCAGDGAGWEDRLGEHVFVRLCGWRTLFPTGAARMALGCGAVALPLFVVRGKKKPFAIVIEPPLGHAGGPSPEAGLAEDFARRYSRRLVADPGFMRFLDVFEPGGLIEPDAPGPVPGDRPQGWRAPSDPN